MLLETQLEVMSQQPYFSGFEPLGSETEKNLMSEAKPLCRKPKNGRNAVVICLHGFTGTPYEVEPVVDAIAHYNLSAVAPLLPGHGYRECSRQKREFARITKRNMLVAARQEIARARQHYVQVGVFGFSMGGAIALSMAAEGIIDACAVAAPALRLPPKAELMIPLLGHFSFNMDAPSKETFYLPGYQFYHSRALKVLWELARYGKQQLPKIRCPILAVHSHNDLTVPPVVLGLMQRQISADIEIAWFDDSGHSMLLDNSGSAVSSKVAQFFQAKLLNSDL